MQDKLLINAGDVIEVQLTSETVVIEGADRRQVEPGHITNRMRLFLREMTGKENKYDFEDTDLGVRETQRVVVVRGQGKGDRQPYNILLYNLSSNERGEFEAGLAIYLRRRAIFGPIGQAVGLALLVALTAWLVPTFITRNGYEGLLGVGLALMFGLLAFPVFWLICRAWDRITEAMRYSAAKKRFLRDMDGRVIAYAPQANANAPAAAPTAPEAPRANPA
jgi:hypothetical protein